MKNKASHALNNLNAQNKDSSSLNIPVSFYLLFQGATVETAWEFVKAPSLNKFALLPRKRVGSLVEEAVKVQMNIHKIDLPCTAD